MNLIDVARKKVLFPANLTLLHEDQTFDEQKQRALIRWLMNRGVDGFYVGGSTGEGPLLTTDIRRQLIKTVVDEVNHRLPVICYIGYADTLQSIDLAQYAEDVGADGISAVPPYYYPFGFDEVYGYYKAISEHVAIPVFVYHIQSRNTMSQDDMVQLLELPNVAGLKFTGSDHYAMQQVKQAAPDKLVFSGRDEQCLSGLITGADGLIGSTYNVIPEIYLAICNHFLAGNLEKAKAAADAANQVLTTLIQNGHYLGAIKALLSIVGIQAPTMRSPMSGISAPDLSKLRRRLAELKDLPELSSVELIQKA